MDIQVPIPLKDGISVGLRFLPSRPDVVIGQYGTVDIARSIYMKKIAMDEAHIQPALTAGVTIDHIFSIIIALLGGVIWNAFGFQHVFLLGILIAALNFLVVSFIHIPPRRLPPENETPIPLRVEGVI